MGSYKFTSRIHVSIFLATLTIQCVFAAKNCNFPAIFNFGDSNSDTGGLAASFGPIPSPSGETFFHSPQGRDCDGRLVIDFIAQSLGLPFVHPYLDSIGANFTRGANFATAGSTIRRQNTTFFQTGYSPFSMDVQSWQYNQFVNRSLSTKNAVFKELLPTADSISNGLYTIDVGQNDLTSAYVQGMTTEQVMAEVPDMIKKLVIVIQNIYWNGGRSFWIHNTGPFGCLPYVLDRFPLTAAQVDKFGCGSTFNSVAQYFNKKLKEAVVQLRKQFPLASFTYVDIYSVKHAVITKASELGFEHPLMACCGHGGKYNFNIKWGCGYTYWIHGKPVQVAKSCKDPSVRVNWDGYHFTEAANKWIFNQIVNGAYSDPPTPISQACSAKDS
ncbi:hypothetical protein MRB53_007637 [Persea americana]|uniref:Uncharacterized protein n=1 Tax=Persea americana TaxID=3435 RepID=A0ACC2MJR9_PERAE|nr:hypothetical protein MRB53_007637 [Persea americana]